MEGITWKMNESFSSKNEFFQDSDGLDYVVQSDSSVDTSKYGQDLEMEDFIISTVKEENRTEEKRIDESDEDSSVKGYPIVV